MFQGKVDICKISISFCAIFDVNAAGLLDICNYYYILSNPKGKGAAKVVLAPGATNYSVTYSVKVINRTYEAYRKVINEIIFIKLQAGTAL